MLMRMGWVSDPPLSMPVFFFVCFVWFVVKNSPLPRLGEGLGVRAGGDSFTNHPLFNTSITFSFSRSKNPRS